MERRNISDCLPRLNAKMEWSQSLSSKDSAWAKRSRSFEERKDVDDMDAAKRKWKAAEKLAAIKES